MLVPMLVPAIYTSALLFGPAFVIFLAIFLALAVRFPRLKGWIGATMLIFGLGEFSLVPAWVFWIFCIELVTVILGTVMVASALLGKRQSIGISFISEKEWGIIGLIAVVMGVVGVTMFSHDLGTFLLWLVILVIGIITTASFLPKHLRVKTGLTSFGAGLVAVLGAFFTNLGFPVLFVGLLAVFGGISLCVSGLFYQKRKPLNEKVLRRLKRVSYVLLALLILSATVVFSLRATHVLREELYDAWTYATVADTTVRGVITGVYQNIEVDNDDYSYHVFPALIIVNVTEVIKADLWSMNLIETRERWMNQNMTVAYNKPDVPSLNVGERVEVRGYYDLPVEDSWSYSNKLVIAAEIDGSQVTSLQG